MNMQEDLGYVEPVKSKVTIDHSIPKRFFLNDLPKKKWEEPPEWVKVRLKELKSRMEKYK